MPQEVTDVLGAGEADRESTSRTVARWRRVRKLALFALLMVTLVVVPFLLFGESLERFARDLMTDPSSRPATAMAGLLLLAADVVLPVPSTIVISVLGALLGVLGATLVAAVGLTLGCLWGYGLGRWLGHDFAQRTMGREDFVYLSDRLGRYGLLVLALCRPIPVLAEASVIVAGVAGLSTGKVLVVTTLANIGFAAVYASFGAAADTGAGLLAALAASLGFPLAAILIARALRRRHGSQ